MRPKPKTKRKPSARGKAPPPMVIGKPTTSRATEETFGFTKKRSKRIEELVNQVCEG